MRKPAGVIRLEEVYQQGQDDSRAAHPSGRERDAEWCALVVDGWTYAAVAVLYGVSPERVYQVIQRRRP